MIPQPVLHTTRLILRPYQLSDAPQVQRLAGVREVADTTLNLPHPYEDGMAEAWIGTHQDLYARGELAAFAITLRDGSLIGAIGLRLEPAHRRGELGYWIGMPFWNRGYATEAGLEIVRYGFSDLGLNRIQATHMTRNPASGRVMQKLGMTYEGCSRQYFLKAGRLEDVERYAILREEGSNRIPLLDGPG
jgi:[ribosomal protein S5]-alanine N-acetyltransferase